MLNKFILRTALIDVYWKIFFIIIIFSFYNRELK